jgi:hypothetical protein
MKTRKIFIGVVISILVAILFVNCDEYARYTTSVNNQTNDTVKIFFHAKSAYVQRTDSVVCIPYTENIYFDIEGRVLKNIDCDPYIKENEVKVVVSGGKILKKNITDKNNWICSGSRKQQVKITFVITENDLE